jgi:chromosome segregation ATPase
MTNEDRFGRLENQVIDIRVAVSTLIETTELHQRNFEVLVTEIREIRADMREIRSDMREIRSDMREMQAEVTGLQTENRRILDVLQGLSDR